MFAAAGADKPKKNESASDADLALIRIGVFLDLID
jgi:hypothetical protein